MLKNSKILVTGGTGLVGRQVVKLLSEQGVNDITVVSLDDICLGAHIKHVKKDLCNFDDCKAMTKGVDFVIHLAGVKGSVDVTLSKPASFLVPTTMMNTNILEACRINGVKKVVYTSSIGAYCPMDILIEDKCDEGSPMDQYPGHAKRLSEKQILTYKIQFGTNWSVVRLANVYGPGDNFDINNAMVIPSLLSKIHRGDSPVEIWGDGSAIRDFVFSEDAAKGIILSLVKDTDSTPINIGSGTGYSIKYLVETLSRLIGFNYVFSTSKNTGYSKRVMDISKARNILGYEPSTLLEDGLKITWDWFLENSAEYLNKKNYFNI